MIARRLLILLLMWLVPLYPVLAGAAPHLQAAAHEKHVVTMTMEMHAAHDCCDMASPDQHSLNGDQGCEAGQCIAHCAISLVSVEIQTPARMDYVYANSGIAPLYSITQSPPARPPSFL